MVVDHDNDGDDATPKKEDQDEWSYGDSCSRPTRPQERSQRRGDRADVEAWTVWKWNCIRRSCS